MRYLTLMTLRHFYISFSKVIHRKNLIKLAYCSFFSVLYSFCLCICALCFIMRVLVFLLSSVSLLSLYTRRTLTCGGCICWIFFSFLLSKILLLNYTFAVTEPEFFSGSYTKFGQNEEILMLLMETCELSILALTQNF